MIVSSAVVSQVANFLMGLMPIYQKPNTSKAAKGHKFYPCLLRGPLPGPGTSWW